MTSDRPSASRRTARKAVAALLFVLAACLQPPAAAAQTGKADAKARAKPANLDRNGVLILTRGTLLALDQANKTGNYTVLRDLGSGSFQNKSAADLAEIFAAQRKQMLDFSAVAVLEPQLTLLPQTEPNGMLHMAGFFPSAPLQINFELLFEPVNRQWRVFGVAVNLTPGGPQAPDKPPEQAKPVDTAPPEPPSVAVGKKKSGLAKP